MPLNPASSPAQPNDTSNLMNLSVDELIAMMNKSTEELMNTQPDTAPGGPDAEMPMAKPGPEAAPSKVMPAGKNMTGMPAALVRDATSALVDAGLLAEVKGQLDTDVMDLLTKIANAVSPGLYDLTDEQQVEELLRGIADGTIELPGPEQLADAGKQQPVPGGGGGLPGAQPVGGLPGGGGSPVGGAGGFNPDSLL